MKVCMKDEHKSAQHSTICYGAMVRARGFDSGGSHGKKS